MMTTINNGNTFSLGQALQISSSQLTKVNIDNFDLTELSSEGMSNREQQLAKQNNVRQSTVIEYQGKVIANFGENGWRQFEKNADVEQRFLTMSNEQVATELQKKYGAGITINHYDVGQGPTAGELFMRKRAEANGGIYYRA